jgi:hypothetical protein
MIAKLFLTAATFVASLLGAGHTEARSATPVYIVGASITRLAKPELLRWFPDATIDAVDGRSMIHPDMYGGPTIMQVFWRWLPELDAGDWLVIEAAHGGVDVPTNRTWMRRIMRHLPDDVCLAWFVPSTAYDAQTPETDEWNRRMSEMIHREIVKQPCNGLIEWSAEVEAFRTDYLGEPLLYDGRHPTPSGTWHYASLLYDVMP